MRWQAACVAIVPYQPRDEFLDRVVQSGQCLPGMTEGTGMSMQSDGEEEVLTPDAVVARRWNSGDGDYSPVCHNSFWFPEEETEYAADPVAMDM